MYLCTDKRYVEMIKFIKTYTLPIAIIIGGVFYKLFLPLGFLMPYLIFIVLLLGFCKVSVKDLHLSKTHIILLLIQIIGSISLYYLLLPLGKILAEGIMICVMCPTAAASTVLTQKLNGDSSSVSSYLLLSNLAVSLVVPLFFPHIAESTSNLGFWTACLSILSKIFPLLILPFIIAEFSRYRMKKLHSFLLKYNSSAFYLWALNLSILTAITTYSLLNEPASKYLEFELGIGAFIVCVIQFLLGKYVGKPSNDNIALGQSLGQKNTILAIWVTQLYLNPLAALAPGTYVIWQNVFNAWQITRKEKGKRPTFLD